MKITGSIKNDVSNNGDFYTTVIVKNKKQTFLNTSYLDAFKKMGVCLPQKYNACILGNSIEISY